MRKGLLFGALALSVVFTGCGTQKNAVGDSSQTSVDWAGVYLGDLTSEKEDFFQLQLTLKNEGIYQLVTSPVGQSDRNSYAEGKFEWVMDGKAIKLDKAIPHLSTNYVLVGENKLFILKENQLQSKPVLNDLPQLKKVETNSQLTEKYWKLISINGRAVTRDDFSTKEPHMIFKTEFNFVKGTDGCNGFGGNYLIDGNTIKFDKMISTMMACPDSFVFNSFMRILHEGVTYKVTDDKLTFKSNKDVMEFEVVYF
jgi:copper homeostasis protein (lipoprotein)